mmetsp:Transcript_11673/g.28694  ORF Transcript_11673/g.28694 Transcript_11673/m.28694 type:complete len:135 (+) Transcript_11673:2-406(+)
MNNPHMHDHNISERKNPIRTKITRSVTSTHTGSPTHTLHNGSLASLYSRPSRRVNGGADLLACEGGLRSIQQRRQHRCGEWHEGVRNSSDDDDEEREEERTSSIVHRGDDAIRDGRCDEHVIDVLPEASSAGSG